MHFEWDEAKNLSNQRKHGVAFEEAKSLFESGVDYLELFDPVHSDSEERFLAVGPIVGGVVVIVWTERFDDVIRIISARWATKRERTLFQSFMEWTHE